MYVSSRHFFFSDPNAYMPIAGVSKKREEGKKEGEGEGDGWNHTGESGETQEGRQGKTQEREEGEEEAQGIVFMIPFLTCIPALIFSGPPSFALSQCVSIVQACSHLVYTPESHRSVIHTSVETRWLPRVREGFVNVRVLVEYPQLFYARMAISRRIGSQPEEPRPQR